MVGQGRLIVSHLRLRRVLGVISIALPFVLMLWGFALSGWSMVLQDSISAYYSLRTRDAFVGTLVVIGLFLLTYRGYERKDDVAGYLACVFALGVAFFPSRPKGWESIVHFSSATGLFLMLSFFSLILFTKTKTCEPPWWRRILSAFRFGPAKSGDSRTTQKRWRDRVYVACGLVMLACIALTGLYIWLFKDTAVSNIKPVFWLESLMIWAFGISWFVKGDWLRLLKDKNQPSYQSDVCQSIILNYLQRNPDAGDTLEGITKWWLELQRIELSVNEIADILESLIRKSLIGMYKNKGGTTFYKINKEKSSQNPKNAEANGSQRP